MIGRVARAGADAEAGPRRYRKGQVEAALAYIQQQVNDSLGKTADLTA